jgi:hypothetical protein
MTESLRPRLVVLQGNQTLGAMEIPPGEEWKLGRQPDSPLPLQERSISRVHVRVFCDDAGVHLEDLGSPNGTFVDGRAITGTITLRDGNMIRLGQSTNPDPILLRFEDPGTRLLEAMAEPAAPPPTAVPARLEVTVRDPPAAAAPAVVAEPAVPDEAAPPDAAAEPTSEPPATEGKAPKTRAAWTLALAIVGGLALVLWAIFALRATQKPWQAVKVEPIKTTAGGRVSLRGSEVEPSDSLKVLVDDKEGTVEEMAPGHVVFTTPVLAETEAGVRPVALKVERKGIVVLRQNLQYETLPRVEAIDPAEAAVGDKVTLKGSGFLSDPTRIKVRVGQQSATVVAASVGHVQFQVPVVTRSVVVDLPLEVEVGEWSVPPGHLKVRPREAPCFAMAFTARSVSDRVWEVRHSLGTALYVEGPAGDEPPPPVARAVEVIGKAFTKAATDPGVQFDVRGGKNAALVVVGLGGSPVEVARWSPVLTAFLHERAPDLRQTELVPYWSSVVLNELLNVFAKRQPPRLLPAEDVVRVALKRLQDLNVETGGQGCPSAAEVQTVKPPERDAFETAVARLPAGFGEVGGHWEGSLENAFSEKATETTLELRLELEQAGTALKGRALVFEVRGPGIRWSPPPVEGLTGGVRLGGETRIDLTAEPTPPYFFTRFTATVADGGMDGSFRTSKGKQGRFQLRFKPAD